MEDQGRQDTDNITKALRWVARIWSIITIGITIFVLIGHLSYEDPGATDYPWIENLMPIAMLVSVSGLGIAFRWELLGGIINISFFIVNVMLYWIINKRFFPIPGLLILSLVIVPGILFSICWWRSRAKP